MSTPEQGREFLKKLEDLVVATGTGKAEINFERLCELVRQEPDLTVVAVKAYLHIAGERRGYLQFAETIAGAYRFEHGDDALLQLVGRTKREMGVTSSGLEIRDGEPAAAERPAAAGTLVNIEFDRPTLASGDIYPVVRTFSVDRAEEEGRLAQLTGMRGRVLLSFALGDDPRPVWRIPESRRLVAKIFDQLPYFPYFLLRDAEGGAYLVFFGCLADPEAGVDEALDLAHASVVEKLVQAFDAIDALSRRLGQDAGQVRREVLSGLPEPYVEWFLDEYPRFR